MTDAKPSTYSWFVASMMMLTYAVQHIDRHIMAVILEPIKKEFSLADAQLGLLSGLAFAVAYSLAVIPLGMLVDRGNRRNILCVVLTVWSGLTALGSLATSYVQLVAARLMVGAAEAGGSPAAIALIADHFPHSRRSSATGLFFFGQGIGILAGFALGGAVVAEYGWRTTLLIAGLPGLALAVMIALTVREPKRAADTAQGDAVGNGMGAAIAVMWRQRSMCWLILGMLFGSAMVAAILIWMVSFLVRQHGVDIGTAGLAVGVGMGISGAIGAFSGGFIADWSGRLRPENVPLQIALTQAAGVLAFAFAFLTGNYLLAVTAGSLGLMLTHARDGPVFALCATLAGSRRRGRVMALILLLNNLVGYGLGPLLAGVLSDYYAETAGSAALQYSLLTVVAMGAIGIVPFLLAARTLRRDLEQVAGEA